jgi:hypothetical protein
MRTLGLIGLVTLLALVILYQSYMLTEGFFFADEDTTSDTSDSCGNSVPVCSSLSSKRKCNKVPECLWNKSEGECQDKPVADDEPAEEETESTYAPYKPSAADKKHQRAKLLRDIQKIVHNEVLSDRSTTASRYPSHRKSGNDYEESCDNSPALQQGCEMEDTCTY